MSHINDKRKQVVCDIFKWYLNGDRQENYIFDYDMYKFMKYHKLDGIYFDYCKAVNENQMPKELNRHYYALMSENENQIAIANDIGIILDEVRYVFLKGLPLMVNNYKVAYHRYFHDIDLLIERSDLSSVEKKLFDSGYQYGWEYQGKMYPAKREDILFQKMNTHETFMMVKKTADGFISYVDVNFLFSWKGLENKEYNKNVFNDLYDCIRTVTKNDCNINCMDSNYMFLHLCCHLYNSAHFFALDRFYSGNDPEELRLIHLMDILLIYREGVEDVKIARLAQEMKHTEKVLFVLQILQDVLDFPINNLYELISSRADYPINVDRYFLSNGEEKYWNIDINNRIFGIEEKKKLFNEVF